MKSSSVDDAVQFVDAVKFYTHGLVYFPVEDTFKVVLDCVNGNTYSYLHGRLDNSQDRYSIKFQFDLYHDDSDTAYVTSPGGFVLVYVRNDGKKVNANVPDNVKKIKTAPPVHDTVKSSTVRVPVMDIDVSPTDEDSLLEKNIRTLFRNYTGTTPKSMNVTLSLYREIILDVLDQQQQHELTVLKSLS